MTNKLKKLASVSAVAVAAMGISPAFAAGTTAGSTITNSATVNYSVGGVSQTAINASNTITVDRKVNLTVAEVGSASTNVNPGQTLAVTTFTVTNNSNASIDVGLGVSQLSGGAAPFGGGNDSFNVLSTSVKMYIDAAGGTAGVYDDGVDTQVTYLDTLAADATKTVYVVATIPLTDEASHVVVNGDIAAVTLTGTARETDASTTAPGAVITATSGANTNNTPGTFDTVLADAAGSDDIQYDGKHSARDDYKVNAPVITVTKLSRVVSDPVNGSTNPKMIPGAIIEYCIVVANAAGGSAATGVTVSDNLSSLPVTYETAFGVKVGGTYSGSGDTCGAGSGSGSYASGSVSGTIGALPTNSNQTVVFQAKIN